VRDVPFFSFRLEKRRIWASADRLSGFHCSPSLATYSLACYRSESPLRGILRSKSPISEFLQVGCILGSCDKSLPHCCSTFAVVRPFLVSAAGPLFTLADSVVGFVPYSFQPNASRIHERCPIRIRHASAPPSCPSPHCLGCTGANPCCDGAQAEAAIALSGRLCVEHGGLEVVVHLGDGHHATPPGGAAAGGGLVAVVIGGEERAPAEGGQMRVVRRRHQRH